MNENKGNDNSRKKITQWAVAKDEDAKMRWIMITKTIMGVIFNLQNSYSSTSSLPTEEIFQVNGQIRLWQVFQLSIFFVLSLEKCHYQSHWKRNFRFFFWYTGFLSLIGKWYGVCKWYGFFSVLAAIIREKFDKLPWIENGESFTVHSSTWPSALKASVSSWLAISNTREKISYFFTCVVAASLRAGNHFITL